MTPLDQGREPPGVPPPPILETPIDRLIDDLFGSTAPGIGARERAYLHAEIERLREWARRRYHPDPRTPPSLGTVEP